jgi:hypothetical protein
LIIEGTKVSDSHPGLLVFVGEDQTTGSLRGNLDVVVTISDVQALVS